MTPASERGLWRWHVGALAIYAVLSGIFIDHGVSLLTNIAGRRSDPFIFVWSFAWWPWAVTHHLNPLYTDVMWQPVGVYTGWVTSVPFLSFIGLPITLLSGPVLTYNVFTLCAPVLSALAAYFLCLKLAKDTMAALIGGYLFGFSSYEMGQDIAALNLNFTMFVPILVLVIIMRLENELSRAQTILFTGIILAVEFLISIEIFALVFVFGGIAWLLALLYLPNQRIRLWRLFYDGLATAPLVIILLSPFLISMLFSFHCINLPIIWPYYFTTDLLNIVLPGGVNEIGGSLFRHLSAHFWGDFQEQGAYIGIPLLGIIILFAKDKRRTPAGRFLLAALLVFIVLSFGPRLWIDGNYSPIVLPWTIFVHLPLLSSALPARFALFSSLIIAVIIALWIAEPVPLKRRRWRIALAILACIALMPRPHPWMKIPHSTFFQPSRVEAVLGPKPRVMVLPFAINGPSSFWQQESNFSFAQTGGYLGFPPAAMQHFAAVEQLFGGTQGPDFLRDFTVFATATNTQYIVAGPGTSAALLSQLALLNWPESKIDDVIIFTVPAAKPDSAAHG